jgi:hypothetical protein
VGGQKNTSPPATRKRPFDAWSRHPAAIDAAILTRAVEAVQVREGGWILDPFAGSARIGTFSVSRGDCYYGIEAHPLHAAAAAVKFTRPGPSAELRGAASQLANRARARSHAPLHEHPLLHRLVPAVALAELAALRDEANEPGPWREHLRACVRRALRRTSKTGASMSGRRAQGPSALFVACANEMADDLELAPRRPSAHLVCGDSRTPDAWTQMPTLADASVTSPPYLNQLAYHEEIRPEAFFFNHATSWADLRALGANLVASCTQQVRKARALDGRRRLSRHSGVAAHAEILAGRLRRRRQTRSRGKTYDWLLWAYLADMAAVMDQLRVRLAPGARAAWVIGDSSFYGVHIDTPALLLLLAAEIGFEPMDDTSLRTRGARWQGASGADGIVLSERLITFRRRPLPLQPRLPGFETEGSG